MQTAWFGKSYSAPAYFDSPQIATPVGELCCYCEEAIAAGDDGWRYANGPVAHRECYLRSIIGSVAHQQRRCSCFGGDANEGDDPSLTRREAARAAVAYMERSIPPDPEQMFDWDGGDNGHVQ